MIIIHEHGEPSHYMGAVEVAEKNNENLDFREFMTLKLINRAIKEKKIEKIIKALIDFMFFIICFIFPVILKNEKIIIGIAPKNWKVIFFNRILKEANVIYHTSWHIWDGSKYPYNNNLFGSFIDKQWQFFLNTTCSKIAAVTETVEKQLVQYMNVEKNKITVVYHAYDDEIFFHKDNNIRENDIIYVGRLIDSKGIDDILKIGLIKKNIKILFIGAGLKEKEIMESNSRNNNIELLGFLKDRNKIAQAYNNSKFLVLPSKRTVDWEELFGMVIIEAMACGCIPICTDHNGPKIILENSAHSKNIFSEKNFIDGAISLLDAGSEDYMLINRRLALELAKKYSKSEIYKLWDSLLRFED